MRGSRIVVAIAAALLLAGGSVATASPAVASTGEYVLFVKSELPSARGIPSGEIVTLGKTICKSLNVLSVDRVVSSADDTGLTMREVSVLVVGAVWFICPRHKGKVQRWIDS